MLYIYTFSEVDAEVDAGAEAEEKVELKRRRGRRSTSSNRPGADEAEERAEVATLFYSQSHTIGSMESIC